MGDLTLKFIWMDESTVLKAHYARVDQMEHKILKWKILRLNISFVSYYSFLLYNSFFNKIVIEY